MNFGPFKKTLIVWWHFGKEHGDENFQVNPPETIAAHIGRKVARFREQTEDDWRWWQVDENLIVERWDTSPEQSGPDTRIYYLLNCGISVIENIHLPAPDDNWKWLIRISDYEYNPGLECWMMKDLFCDVVVERDNRTYHMFDLPDLAQALDVGLISAVDTRNILHRVDWLVNSISRGEFPFSEVEKAQAACQKLGW
ncbi:MAG: hypothetical protein EHM70_16500 [Chloroflexota bacterium]|nr:MAG: hypothetical protein EHM70_16500 [Chloroflexota bacterium]